MTKKELIGACLGLRNGRVVLSDSDIISHEAVLRSEGRAVFRPVGERGNKQSQSFPVLKPYGGRPGKGQCRGRHLKSSKGLSVEQSRCHNNSAIVAHQRGWEWWTGMAYLNGEWLAHSWVVIPSTGTVVETTIPREIYYGVKMGSDQAEALALCPDDYGLEAY